MILLLFCVFLQTCMFLMFNENFIKITYKLREIKHFYLLW